MNTSKKLLFGLAAVGVVVILLTGVLIWMMARWKAEPETQAVVVEPIVLGPDLTFGESRTWGEEVPHGTQVLDNVTFVCDGALRTAGLRSSKPPGAVLGIPIQHKGTRMHLLQAAENSPGNFVGIAYGHVRFHFANGESRDFYLRFGVHGRDWFQLKPQLSEMVTDPNTSVAWVAEHKRRGVWVRLFHTALENPFPNETITSVDAISPLGGGNLLLFAISVDNDSVALQPPLDDGWAPDYLTLAFSLQNSDGTPRPGGSVRWKAAVGRVAVDFPPFPCDSSGRMSMDFPTHAITEIRYTAADGQGATTIGTVTRPPEGWSPTQKVAVVFAGKP